MNTEQETRTPSLKFWMVVIILILLGLLINSLIMNNIRVNESDRIQSALKDSIRTWVDKDGYNRAKISVIEATTSKAFTELASKDSTIIKLQDLVRKNSNQISNGGSITIINTEGNISTTVPTMPIDTTINGFPTYESSFNLKGWVIGEVIARKDSTDVTLKYRDEFNLVIGREKTGFLGLGKTKPYADLTSKSPYSTVKNLRVYQDAPENIKYWHIGPGVFYGIGTDFKPQPFVGVGIMWTPINF